MTKHRLDPKQYQVAADFVSRWNRVLITSHIRPDGDALGSLLATRRALRRLGKTVTAILLDQPSDRYGFLIRDDLLPLLGRDVTLEELNPFDGIVIVDTGAFAQLEPLADFLKRSSVPRLLIDHHVTRDVPADCLVIDETASAASLIIAEWMTACGWPIDEITAQALFTGIATDTGWFRFSNTDRRTFDVAGQLLAHGVKPDFLYQQIYASDPPAKLRLIAALLDRMELLADNRVAVGCLNREAFERTGAKMGDSEDIINEMMRCGPAIAGVLLTEQADGQIRVNFRSKRDVNVAALAARFGGGGHERAAGARIRGTIDEVKGTVVQAVLEQLSSARGES